MNFPDTRGLYGVIGASIPLEMAIQDSPVNPMKALFWSAVLSGLVAVPLMAVNIVSQGNR